MYVHSSFRPEQEVDLRTVLRNNVDLTGLTMEDIQIVAETCAVASQSAFNESSIYQGSVHCLHVKQQQQQQQQQQKTIL